MRLNRWRVCSSSRWNRPSLRLTARRGWRMRAQGHQGGTRGGRLRPGLRFGRPWRERLLRLVEPWQGIADRKYQGSGDRELLYSILDQADVFIQNLAPGAAARAGFGSDELRKRNPQLITVDISGYGEEGSYADMKAYDLLVQAESGLCSITGLPEGPGRVGVGLRCVLRHVFLHGGTRSINRTRRRRRIVNQDVAVRRHGRLDDGAAASLRLREKIMPRVG